MVVANASGVPGSAGRMSTTLAAAGFTMAEATNATSQLEVSVVYYDPAVVAAQAVAESVARSMGGLEVAPVPTPVPIEGAALNGSGVVVMLGTRAGRQDARGAAAPATGSHHRDGHRARGRRHRNHDDRRRLITDGPRVHRVATSDVEQRQRRSARCTASWHRDGRFARRSVRVE